MSVLFPNGYICGTSGWVARSFFEDCAAHLVHAPRLSKGILFCFHANVDTLDLTDADVEALSELEILINLVVQENEHHAGKGWAQPDFHPVYMRKLEELQSITDEVIEKMAKK